MSRRQRSETPPRPRAGAQRPSATSLPESATDDQNRRMRGYLISMTVRTVCFLGTVITWQWSRPVAVVFLAFAVILPYVAVVFANATGQRKIDKMGALEPPPVPRKEVHGSAKRPE